MKHLLFQVAAVMMSSGSPGAKKVRPTDSHLSKGLVSGLLGAAQGKTRDDPWHQQAESLGFAVMTVKAGSRLVDYHTVATVKGNQTFNTRYEEVEATDYTIETWREYLSDAYFVVAVWSTKDFDLEAARNALISPTFELFAGRKCCPLSLPPAPEIIECDSLAEAFHRYSKNLYKPLLPKEKEFLVHWEPHPNPGIPSDRNYLRHDQVINRAKRLFRQRTEHEGVLKA